MADPLLNDKINNLKAQIAGLELNAFLDSLVVEDASEDIDDANADQAIKNEAANARSRLKMHERRLVVRKARLTDLEVEKAKAEQE
jgi:hypothetical protein